MVNFAPIPEVPKHVGKSWPLNKNYYEKVKQNAPELVKPAFYAKVNEAYDGKQNKSLKASLKNQSAIKKSQMISASNAQDGIRNNLAHYTAKPDYLIQDSVMYKTTTAMKTKNVKSSPLKGGTSAFHRGRASLATASPGRRDVKYAVGNKDQVNLVI